MSSIPVIDFQKYGLHIEKAESVPREDLKELGDQMCQALKNIGFCYLKNHGVPDAQVYNLVYNAVFTKAAQLTNLCVKAAVVKESDYKPTLVKQKNDIEPSNPK